MTPFTIPMPHPDASPSIDTAAPRLPPPVTDGRDNTLSINLISVRFNFPRHLGYNTT
jgi:hypothetical protein